MYVTQFSPQFPIEASFFLQNKSQRTKKLSAICGEQIMMARKNQQLSQRQLATMLGKSQSWIRDIESGRFQLKGEDQMLLQNVLGLGG